MKSLGRIQKLFRIGAVLIDIIRIFCIISAVFCTVGLVLLATVKGLQLSGESVNWFNKEIVGGNYANAMTDLAFSLVSSLAELYLCKFAKPVFEMGKELPTPFHKELSEGMLQLGLRVIVVTLSVEIASAILFAIIRIFVNGLDTPDMTFAGNIAVGIGMLIVSQILQYGAEVVEKNHLSNDDLQ